MLERICLLFATLSVACLLVNAKNATAKFNTFQVETPISSQVGTLSALPGTGAQAVRSVVGLATVIEDLCDVAVLDGIALVQLNPADTSSILSALPVLASRGADAVIFVRTPSEPTLPACGINPSEVIPAYVTELSEFEEIWEDAIVFASNESTSLGLTITLVPQDDEEEEGPNPLYFLFFISFNVVGITCWCLGGFGVCTYVFVKRARDGKRAHQAIKHLPVRKFHASDLDIDPDSEEWPVCAVCLENFEDGCTLRTLKCNHEFHRDCLDPWIQSHLTCPLCKASILPERAQPEATDGQGDSIELEAVVTGMELTEFDSRPAGNPPSEVDVAQPDVATSTARL